MALSFHKEVDVLVSSPICVAIVYKQYCIFYLLLDMILDPSFQFVGKEKIANTSSKLYR